MTSESSPHAEKYLNEGLIIRRRAAGDRIAEILMHLRGFEPDVPGIEVRRVGKFGGRVAGINIVTNTDISDKKRLHHLKQRDALTAISEAVPNFMRGIEVEIEGIKYHTAKDGRRFLIAVPDQASQDELVKERQATFATLDKLANISPRDDWKFRHFDMTLASLSPEAPDYLDAPLKRTANLELARGGSVVTLAPALDPIN